MSTARQAIPTGALGFGLAVLVLLVTPGTASAQQTCRFGEGSGLARVERDPRGGNLTRLTTPHFECEGGVEIWSDSTIVYQVDRLALLFGSVRYLDGQRELRTDRGRYFYEIGRFEAQGSVGVTNYEDGSRVENGDLVYLRQTETRDIEEMTFTTGSDGLRPHAIVYPRRAPAQAGSVPGLDDVEASVEVAPPADGAVDALAADTLVADGDPSVEPEAAEPVETVPVARAGGVAAADTTGAAPAEPEAYQVTGDRLYFRGDSYFDATGDVEIVRDSLFAFSETAEYDGEVGSLLLEGSARVLGSGYELVGRTIELASRDDGSDEVRAKRDAFLTGDDLNVTAPQIVLHLQDGELERMVAVPLSGEPDSTSVAAADASDADAQADTAVAAPARPFAVSQDMELTADSLDMIAPGGELERIFAAGTARSVSSTRDDLNVEELPELARHDWMEGDTIEVFLVPVVRAPGDTVRAEEGEADYQVDRIIARVAARSLYRLTPSDSTAVPGVDPPALSYIVANRITIFMVDGQADRVESVGQVTGWHLEPLSRQTEPEEDAAPADSTAAPTDPLGGSVAPPRDPGAGNGGDGAAPDAYFFPGL